MINRRLLMKKMFRGARIKLFEASKYETRDLSQKQDFKIIKGGIIFSYKEMKENIIN